MANHTIEVIRRNKNKDDEYKCRDQWTISINGVEMDVLWSDVKKKDKDKNENNIPLLIFSNKLLRKHKDYAKIRLAVIEIIRSRYYSSYGLPHLLATLPGG